MLTIGNLMILAGYTLLYASVANSGALAANPWLGLVTDAYTPDAAADTIDAPTEGDAPKRQRRRQDKRAGPLAKSLIPTPAPY